MDKDLEALHKKVDFLTEQVMETKRRQQEWREFREDLTPVMTDAFNSATEELDKISPYFSYEDFLFLGMKLLRNTRNLTALFERFEGAVDFVDDAKPLSREIFDSMLEWLDEFEKRGYFSLLQSFLVALDKFVTQLSKDDMEKMAENLPRFLNLLNELNNTSLVDDLEKGVEMYKNMDIQVPEKVSIFTLLKEANDPHVRKGIIMGLSLVKQLSAQLQNKNSETQTLTNTA